MDYKRLNATPCADCLPCWPSNDDLLFIFSRDHLNVELPGLRLDRKKAEVGAGVGKWIGQDFDYKLEISPRGVDCFAALTLKDGRPLSFRISENRQRPSKPITILAPLGAGIQQPNFLPLFRMHDIDLVQRAAAEFEWKIGDEERAPRQVAHSMDWANPCRPMVGSARDRERTRSRLVVAIPPHNCLQS